MKCLNLTKNLKKLSTKIIRFFDSIQEDRDLNRLYAVPLQRASKLNAFK
ncbi:unnamed protein product [Commensalibacter communis]|nr:unnamed protein product [Commensalibacter communis]CAI3945870.1 unnamed protein product [Commensalibacter communis]